MTIMAPRNEDEVAPMLEYALTINAPAALRYPRGSSLGLCTLPLAPIRQGRAEVLQWGRGVAVLALGSMVDIAYAAVHELPELSPTIVNARFVVPLDRELLQTLQQQHHTIITLEEAALAGGFGSAVLEAISDLGLSFNMIRLGIGPQLIAQASTGRQREWCGIDPASVASHLAKAFGYQAKESLIPCPVL